MMHHFAPPRTSPPDDWIVDPKRGRNPTRPSHPRVTESIFVLYEVAERDAGSRRSRKSPTKPDFVLDTPSLGGASARGTVEKLHSRAKTPKGPIVVGPFDFSGLLVAGAGFEPATFGL